MKSATRRRALESTAKVALGCYFGAAAEACGGISTMDAAATAAATASAVPPPVATGTAPPPVATGAVPLPAEPPVPMLACLPPVTVVDLKLVPPLEDAQSSCCHAYVDGLVAAGMAPPAVTTVDPALLNCCRAFAYSGLWDTTPAHQACCTFGLLSVIDHEQPYCSPWGPPVPPTLVLA